MEIATDLHGHTLFSDGRHTPEELVDHRRGIGMRVVAITDHDVLTAIPRGAAAAARAGLHYLPAVEVTAFLHFGTPAAEQVHLLAYFPVGYALPPRLRRTELYRRGLRVEARWRAFVLAWMDGLAAEDRAAIDPEGLLAAIEPADFPALQSMIDRIVARRRPLFEPFRDHHVRFWEDERELFGWSPEEAMDAIRADGAVDVVAHPARYRDKDRTAKILDRATGIEVYTSRHKPEIAAAYRALAEQKKKLWTASSDDHQNARYLRPAAGTPVHTVERLLGRTLPLEAIYAG
ncbi:Putative metal-dependent phosphoesterase [Minicystis rosea]|nr:Putative metal-dependent phosphoesterase [Minicystis rosea]